MHYGGSKIRLKKLASLWNGQWSARLGKVQESQRCCPPGDGGGGAAGRGLVCSRGWALTALICGPGFSPIGQATLPRPQAWADRTAHPEWRPCSRSPALDSASVLGNSEPGLPLPLRLTLSLLLRPLLAAVSSRQGDGAAEAGTQSPLVCPGSHLLVSMGQITSRQA